MADTVIAPLANGLLSCFDEALAANPNPPAQVCLRAGDQILHDIDAQSGVDVTCCPGLGYVRLGLLVPSMDFPAPDVRPYKPGGCGPSSWSLELFLGTVRCIPGMGDPSGPGCADWTAVATQEMHDIDAMRQALCCWSQTLPRMALWTVQGSFPTMAADCIERQMQVSITIPKCC